VIDRARLSALSRSVGWVPQPGPQLQAFLSPADQLLYGGAAGGGKTALAVGLALTKHRRTLFIRREAIQLQAVIDEIAQRLGGRDGFNGQERIWRLPGGRQIQFGGVPNLGDETKFQGNPRDLLVLDEAANLLELQVQFLLGWVRSTDRGQRCRALLCTNPPTSAEGEWLIRWFAPWLNPKFPKPALPGELRWVAMVDGEERWVDGPEPFVHKGETIMPVSRSFIPSRVTDNRFLAATNYVRQLQALPEPLRSQMLHGDFAAGRADDEWQVIPSAWIKAAMERWAQPTATLPPVSSVGVDPSRGGDETTIAARRGWRYDELVTVKPDSSGVVTGGAAALRASEVAGEDAPVHVDVIGIGASVLDHLDPLIGRRVVAVNGAEGSDAMDMTGKLPFVNRRAECWWRFREALSPDRAPRVALPPDPRLLADLCAPRYRLTSRGLLIEDKEQIKKRLGRSPDRGDAVVLAGIRTMVIQDNRTGERTVARAFGSAR
jgi:hypothetical protein